VESAAESRDSAVPLKAAQIQPVHGQGRGAGLPASPSAASRTSEWVFSAALLHGGVLAGTGGGPQIHGMIDRRHIVERRLLPDRRSGWDRRAEPRRLSTQPADLELRLLADRRRPFEGRSPVPRRAWGERRQIV
jgi:hypothetical protein